MGLRTFVTPTSFAMMCDSSCMTETNGFTIVANVGHFLLHGVPPSMARHTACVIVQAGFTLVVDNVFNSSISLIGQRSVHDGVAITCRWSLSGSSYISMTGQKCVHGACVTGPCRLSTWGTDWSWSGWLLDLNLHMTSIGWSGWWCRHVCCFSRTRRWLRCRSLCLVGVSWHCFTGSSGSLKVPQHGFQSIALHS